MTKGLFDHGNDGQSWMNLEFVRDGATLAPTGRVRIAIDSLGCDPTVRPFLEHVAATEHSDRGRLSVASARTPFERNERLDVRIDTKSAQSLYCWVLAPDETAYIALPIAGAEQKAHVPAGTSRYPRSFNLPDIVLEQSFDNLFSCFGIADKLPQTLHDRWMALAPSQDKDPPEVRREDVLDLLEKIRAVPGVVEATTPVTVK
jgi:hypothetical protein